MKRGLALFDFDGTITNRDTLIELIKFRKGLFNFYIGILCLTPVLILFKLRLIQNSKAKEIVLSFFFAKESQNSFQEGCDEFISSRLPTLLRSSALNKIRTHLEDNQRVVVVTASAYNWVEGWCREMNIELIATKLEFKDGLLTGKLESLNCNGAEKVNRIKAYLNINDHAPIYAYGNSSGDNEMLALADCPFFKKF